MKASESFAESVGFQREFLAVPPTEPSVRFLWNYWTRLKGRRVGPKRSEVNPAELTRYLPQLVIVETEFGPPLRFRYRLSGTQADAIHGHSLTNHYIDTLKPDVFAEALQADFAQIVETAEPQYVRLTFINEEGQFRSYNVLRMPLSEDGRNVDKLLIFTNFRF